MGSKAEWLTPANGLSLFRLLVGLAFPALPVSWRAAVVAVAALSDALDGALSRFTRTAGAVGRALDPIADKVFMAAVLVTLLAEGTLTVGQLALLVLRDIAVFARAGWVLLRHGPAGAAGARPTPLGKLTTALQFLTLFVVVLKGEVVPLVFVPTAVVSGLAGLEYLARPLLVRGGEGRGDAPA
jgi:phosphatidylglycerophosphate synthase